MALQILIVEEDSQHRDEWTNLCREQGHRVFAFADGNGAVAALDAGPFDLALLSFASPDACLQLQTELKKRFPACQVSLLTERPSESREAHLLESGARSVLFRPIGGAALGQLIGRVARNRRATPVRVPDTSCLDAIVGASPGIAEIRDMIRRVAVSSSSTVLITGESGTGKELVARAVHFCSPRAGGAFIEVNCAAIPPNLLESELFGHEAGAFTHAIHAKPGLFEVAQGGTIFLDEIGEIALDIQAKLLRVLDRRSVRRVGGNEEMALDVRVVAATNRDLKVEVLAGKFRNDLFHRLSVVPLELPPLRERRTDVRLIADHYLGLFARKFGRKSLELSPEVYERLEAHSWPGNVRELANLIEQAVLMNAGPVLGSDAFGALWAAEGVPAVRVRETSVDVDFSTGPIDLEAVERRLIERALDYADGNVSQAARLLGLGRGALRHRVQTLGIEPLRRAG